MAVPVLNNDVICRLLVLLFPAGILRGPVLSEQHHKRAFEDLGNDEYGHGRQGGRVWMESEGKERGRTFRFTVPGQVKGRCGVTPATRAEG
jgi:hypothetical protein